MRVQEEKGEQPAKAPPAIPTTEEEPMEVVDRQDDDTMASSFSSCSYVPRSPIVAPARSGGDGGVAQPAAKRTRLSYYPFSQQQLGDHKNKPRVTLPCWYGAK